MRLSDSRILVVGLGLVIVAGCKLQPVVNRYQYVEAGIKERAYMTKLSSGYESGEDEKDRICCLDFADTFGFFSLKAQGNKRSIFFGWRMKTKNRPESRKNQ